MAPEPTARARPRLASFRDGFREVRDSLRVGRVLQELGDLAREDAWVTRAVLVFVLVQCAWIGWDLPGMIGWENDGVAPRDFFAGVFNNLAPGRGHRYPLFHNLILLLASLPVLLACVVSGPLRGAEIAARVTSVAGMTALSLLIRVIHVALGGVTLLLLARITRRLFGLWAGRGALLCAVASVTIGYYLRASNLDGPYMFWTVLAFDRLLTVIERGERRDYALLGICIAASVATKDQAYAGYVLSLPLGLILWPWLRPSALAAGSAHFTRLQTTLAGAGLGYAVFAGVIINPTGLATRIALLTGPNSQEWRNYARGLQGTLLNLHDLFLAQGEFFWHWGLVGACWAGMLLALFRTPGAPAGTALDSRVARLLPLAFGLSSVAAFTLPVARCEHRFLLPFGVWLCVYGGVTFAWLQRRGGLGVALLLALGLSWGISATRCVALGLTQWGDARRGVVHALAELPPGSVVETYGFSVYQPQFDGSPDAPYRVERVGKEPENKRAKLASLHEVVDSYAAVTARRPTAVVMNEGFVTRFLPRSFRPGEAPSDKWLEAQADQDAVNFFRGAVTHGIQGFHLASQQGASLPRWLTDLGMTPVAIHDCTAQREWLFVRDDAGNLSRETAAPAR